MKMNRRDFLGWMSAVTALMTTEACTRQPIGGIIPYTRMPEHMVPGKPLYYATVIDVMGRGTGVVVETEMGRPTKIEGNELHPGSLGGTNAFLQAEILALYDPDRSRAVLQYNQPSTWDNFTLAVVKAQQEAAAQGKQIAILTESVLSPSLYDAIQRLLKKYPGSKWYRYEPIHDDSARDGAEMAFGRVVNTVYDFSQADVILSLDSDFVWALPGSLRYSRDFMKNRRVEKPEDKMNRLYVLESSRTLTGGVADHRLAVKPSLVGPYAAALGEALGVGQATVALSPAHKKWIDALAKDLMGARGRSIVIPGEGQSPELHALAHHLNGKLGNFGKTVRFHAVHDAYRSFKAIRELVTSMNEGKVGALVMLGGNPAYTAPADIDFKKAITKVPFAVHLSRYANETSELCSWHVPEAHPLESWGDSVAYDGTLAIRQPCIRPLFEGKSALEVVEALLGTPHASGYDAVKKYWMNERKGPDFEKNWRSWLNDGVIPDSASAEITPKLTGNPPKISAPGQGLEIRFRPDYSVWDGRYANNGWLQELPRPFSMLTWDNAAYVSVDTRDKLGANDGDEIEITLEGRTIKAGIMGIAGEPDDNISLSLGYGRSAAGRLGTWRGFNAYGIRTTASPWFASGLLVKRTGKTVSLVAVHDHFRMEGRDLAKQADLDAFRREPSQFKDKKFEGRIFEPSVDPNPTKYPPAANSGEEYQWGMSINLGTCIGCNACVVACQSENNIPIVGKDQVRRGREMHWLRIDNYYDAKQTHFQPVPCMHCETAPCELVCPVDATLHDHEGINQMVYNRCVGTRYCSNNCPYKVRRFNFYNWKDPSALVHLGDNPDVTVRERGVMEKCTYCIQRINEHKIGAEKEDRSIRPGEFTTACAQACPTQAIIFGNIKNDKDEVARLKKLPLDYSLLDELNTKPRTTYLAKIKNPNPELKGFG